MTKEQLQRECDFGGAIIIAEKLFSAKLITSNEYKKIKKLFVQKYAPVIAGSNENPKFIT